MKYDKIWYEGTIISIFDDNIYLIDFGFCKSYMLNYKHIPQKNTSSLIGSPSYASINSHKFIELSRRDDLESLGYMLISYACNPGLMVQPVDSNDLNSDKWHRLFSFDGGDNYFMESSVVIEKNKVKLLFKEDYSNEQKLSNRNAFKVFESYNPPLFKQIVFVMEFECGATKYKFSTETYYDNKNEPFFLNKFFSETPLMFDIKSTDPSFFLMKKFCST